MQGSLKTKPRVIYNNSVARPVPKMTVNTLIVPPTLHRRWPLLIASAPCVVSPALVVGAAGALLTFLSNCVGNMFGVVDTWNCGASGLPSNWNRCSLYPVTGSWNICHIWYSSVSL